MTSLAHFESDNELATSPTAQRIEKRMLPARVLVADTIRSCQDDQTRWKRLRDLVQFVESAEYRRLLNDVAAATRPATRAEIVKHIAMMLAAFPSMVRAETKAYGAILAADIFSTRPSSYALDTAMAKLRRSATFCPSVGEVIRAIEDAEETIAANARVLAWMRRLSVEAKREAETLVRDGVGRQ